MDNDVKLDLILSEITGMKSEVSGMKPEMNSMKDDINDVKLTLDHVTNSNIEILGEGHQFINRRLDDAIRSESNIEMTRLGPIFSKKRLKNKKSSRDLRCLYSLDLDSQGLTNAEKTSMIAP